MQLLKHKALSCWYWEHHGYCMVVLDNLIEIRRESPLGKTIAWTYTLDEAQHLIDHTLIPDYQSRNKQEITA